MEVAIATRTHPREWVDVDPAMLATTIDVLERNTRKGR